MSSSPRSNSSAPLQPNKKILETQIPFNVIYDNYMKQIEERTQIQRKYIFLILGIACFFFMIGRLEIIITYILTGYFPIRWGYEDYHNKERDFSKMWGSYSGIFFVFFLLDCFHTYFIDFIPLYFYIRTFTLLWLYLPCFKGAIVFYNVIFVEVLKCADSLRSKIDEKDSMLFEIKEKLKAKKD